jgi:hypothetical protein
MLETLDIKTLQAHDFLNPDSPIGDPDPLERQAQRNRIKALAADFVARAGGTSTGEGLS